MKYLSLSKKLIVSLLPTLFLLSHKAVSQGDTTYFEDKNGNSSTVENAYLKFSREKTGSQSWKVTEERKETNWVILRTTEITTVDGVIFQVNNLENGRTSSSTIELRPSSSGGYQVKDVGPFYTKTGRSSQFFPLCREEIWTTTETKTGRKTEEIWYKNGKLTGQNKYYLSDGSSLDNVYTFVDEDPAFLDPGESLMSFISKEIHYPALALKEKIEGKVFISFFISKAGTVLDPLVLRGIGYGCDDEGVRVIKASQGKWKPGKLKGKPVNCRLVIPIVFKLTK